MHDVDDDQAERVFLGALERRPEERDALLDEVCGGDAALKARVSVLLEAHEQAGTFLEVTPTTTAPPANGDVAGHRIGHYTVRRVIASGGMGVVYEAVQEHPHRTVALKVLRAGIASPSALRRFELRVADPGPAASPQHRAGVRGRHARGARSSRAGDAVLRHGVRAQCAHAHRVRRREEAGHP